MTAPSGTSGFWNPAGAYSDPSGNTLLQWLQVQNGALTVTPGSAFGPTGLSGRVLHEHNFSDGTAHGWVPLFTPLSGSGTNWGTLNCISRGIPRIALRTPDVAGVGATGIFRTTRGMYGDGRYLVEFLMSLENATATTDRPAAFSWGLDYASVAGTRRYFEIVFDNYDEGLASQVQKFRLNMGGGTYQDITGGGSTNLMNRANENKVLPHYLAFIISTADGTYRGLRLNDEIMVGSLNPTPDTTLQAYGAVTSTTLTTFGGGLNPFFTITNRAAAGVTRGTSSILWHRLSFLGV